MMHLDDLLLALAKTGQQGLCIPDTWAQGRTVYGGLTAALVLRDMQQKMSRQNDDHRPVRYLNVSFVGPLKVNVPIHFESTVLRSGRSATQVMTTVLQAGQTCVVAQGCFAIERDSAIHLTDRCGHEMTPPKKANFIPQIPRVVPRFLRHFEINLQAGRLPFMRGTKSHLHGWMRFKKPPAVLHEEHVIAAIDAWPSTVLQQLKKPAAASTMNWNLAFTQTAQLPTQNDWMAYQATTAHAASGYVIGDAHIWNSQGQLMALSRQTVGVFG